MAALRYRRILVRTYLFFGLLAPAAVLVLLAGVYLPEESVSNVTRISMLHGSGTVIMLSVIAMVAISNFVRCRACDSLILIYGFPFRKPHSWQNRRWYVDLDTSACPVCQSIPL